MGLVGLGFFQRWKRLASLQPCPLAFRLAVDELLAGRLVENQDLVAFDDGDVAGPPVS